jgi:hypothetical protein
MTVSTVENRKTYNGNGVTDAFATPYFLADSDLAVYVDSVLQTITTNYTVTGAGVAGGGEVTFVTPPLVGVSNVVILVDPELTQLTDWVENDRNGAEVKETAFDKLTIIAQRLKDKVDRSVRLADDDVTADLEVPALADRLSKYLAFDTNGDLIAVAPTYTVDAAGLVFNNKAEAQLYITLNGITDGQPLLITSSDGGVFVGVTGAAPGTYADNGGAYCGTQFIPTGGDGSSAIVRTGHSVLLPEMFGGAADDATDSLAAIQLACNESAATGKKVLISGPYYIAIADENDPIELLSNAHIEFTEYGSIRSDYFGLPFIFANGQDGITIANPTFIYDATLAVSLPASTAAFVTAQGITSTPARDIVAALLIYGCDNMTVTNPRFLNTSLTTTTTHQHCITIAPPSSILQSNNNRILGDIYIEAAHMGILAWGQNELTIGNIRQKYMNPLDVATYTWTAAGHPIYISSSGIGSSNVTIGDIYDEGLELSGGFTGDTPVTMQLRYIDGLKHGKVTSFNPYGLGDYSAVKNANCGDVFWKGTDAAKLLPAGRVMALLAKNIGSPQPLEFQNLHFSRIALHCPDTTVILISGAASHPNFIDGIFIDDLIIDIDGAAHSSSIALVYLSSTNSRINTTVIGPNLPAFATLVLIEDGGSNNYVDCHLISGPFDTFRVLNEQSKPASENNSFRLTDNQGATRVVSNNTALETRQVSTVLTGLTGASVNATGLLPDGAIAIGVTTYVRTALGTTGGTTGYSVGDGTDADRWGSKSATAIATQTQNSDWTVGTLEAFTAAKNVVITALGGNFDGTGDMRVGVTYLIGKSDGNLHA